MLLRARRRAARAALRRRTPRPRPAQPRCGSVGRCSSSAWVSVPRRKRSSVDERCRRQERRLGVGRRRRAAARRGSPVVVGVVAGQPRGRQRDATAAARAAPGARPRPAAWRTAGAALLAPSRGSGGAVCALARRQTMRPSAAVASCEACRRAPAVIRSYQQPAGGRSCPRSPRRRAGRARASARRRAGGCAPRPRLRCAAALAAARRRDRWCP